ncbi:MAG: Flagellar hook-length control protein, partial [Holophagaceae bacterium]|nr:Flagellar hook-length control protein [Holophagaceae bacterium]
TAKPAPKQQPRIQEQTASDTSTQAPLIRKDTPAVSEEPLFEPIRIKTKANSTQDTPTPQTAEAALGLKPPSPKPALTEFLSRPIPAMETPSVVHAIQEAKGASTTQAVPLAAPLPGIESSQSPELFQGRESRSGRGAQSEAQSNPSATPTTTFTLNAPMAALAKATVPEVAATRPSLPMEQMEGTVRWVLNNQQNSAELQLRPESLGKVQIQLKVEGNQVHAKVWASESSTVPLLESHRGMLEASLREQGLSLGSFDLRHGQGAPRHPMDQPNGQASFAGPVLDFGKEPSLEIPAISTPGVFGNRRVEVFA